MYLISGKTYKPNMSFLTKNNYTNKSCNADICKLLIEGKNVPHLPSIKMTENKKNSCHKHSDTLL